MKKEINKHTTVVVMVMLSLSGLGIVQLNWLNQSINTNRELYKQRIDLIAEQSSELYRSNSETPKVIHQLISNNGDTEFVINKLTSIINKSFEENSLQMDYKFGIYKHENSSSIRKIIVMGNLDNNEYKSFQCINDVKRTYGWASLTCNNSNRCTTALSG